MLDICYWTAVNIAITVTRLTLGMNAEQKHKTNYHFIT